MLRYRGRVTEVCRGEGRGYRLVSLTYTKKRSSAAKAWRRCDERFPGVLYSADLWNVLEREAFRRNDKISEMGFGPCCRVEISPLVLMGRRRGAHPRQEMGGGAGGVICVIEAVLMGGAGQWKGGRSPLTPSLSRKVGDRPRSPPPPRPERWALPPLRGFHRQPSWGRVLELEGRGYDGDSCYSTMESLD